MMRRLLATTVVALTTATAMVGAGQAAGAAQGPERSWIVALRDDVDAAASGRPIAEGAGGRATLVFDHALNGFAFRGSDAAVRRLAADRRVLRIEPDRAVHALDTIPAGVIRIDGDGAHTAGHTGAGAAVAVIDTGVDLNHPDLVANIHPTLGKDCVNGDSIAQDDNGHGTHVAGTVAATMNSLGVRGVAPGASLVPVKVLDRRGSGSWSSVICGIDYVAANAGQIDVANMSLGGSGSAGASCSSSALRMAICGAKAAGVTVVVAAGNNNGDSAAQVPAAYPEVITVSALDDATDTLASFSNDGAPVDLAAPGVRVLSTYWNDKYAYADGTSMASPHVAGVAALVKAIDPTLTPDEVEALLESTGECADGTENAATSGNCAGHGSWSGDTDGFDEPLVDALAAATAAAGTTPPPPPPGSNESPTAAFTEGCNNLACTFDATGSSDPDGTVVRYDWTWGDGSSSPDAGATPGHEFPTGGNYTVTLTVTDDGGATASTSHTVTATNPALPSPISLTATGTKVKGTKYVDLSWSGASGTDVVVYRNGAPVATTANDGAWSESLGKGGGSYTYVVCETSGAPCSNEATVTF